jgi:predicted TIM-barrel fold metal-dependent hydrolase
MAHLTIDRRQLLQTGATVVASVITGSAGQLWAEKIDPNSMIDAHSHIWTRDVASFPLATGVAVDDLAPPSFTAEELLELARPLGVQRVVLIAHHPYYGFDNRYLIDAAKRYEGVFKIVGQIDDRQPHPERAMKQLLTQHVTGFRITPGLRGKSEWLDNPGMRAMWGCAAETGQAICCLIDPDDLPQVDGMCNRFPQTPVVIDHFARIGVDGTIREQDLNRLTRLARFPRVHVKVSAFYALGNKKPPHDELIPMIRRLHEAFGAERLMWASDAPYQLAEPNSYQASLKFVKERIDFLSPQDRDSLLRTTAEKVYFSI